MNNNFVGNSVRFILLILLQVLVFNHMPLGFLGNINAFPYVIFVLLLPIKLDRLALLTISFVFGLILDMFENTGGVNAAACLVLAYVRPLLLVSSFGITYENQSLKFADVNFKEMFIYVLVGTLLHHIVLFSLEVFNISHVVFILKQIALSTLFTSVCVLLFFGLTKRSKT